MLHIIFGLPGAGKTYVGKLIAKEFGHIFHDGDDDITDAIKIAVESRSAITEKMRDEYFVQLFKSIECKYARYQNLVVAQTFIKERFREQALLRFPSARFILVKAYPRIREQRLVDRVSMPMDRHYARNMARRFDEPRIPHQIIINNTQGEAELLPQLRTIFQ